MSIVAPSGCRPRSGNVPNSIDAVGVVSEQADENQFWKTCFGVPTEPLFKFLFSEVDSISMGRCHCLFTSAQARTERACTSAGAPKHVLWEHQQIAMDPRSAIGEKWWEFVLGSRSADVSTAKERW